MFTQTEIELVDSIEKLAENERYSKYSLHQLTKIREKYDGRQPRECFCSVVRRKVWSKDFMVWYEKSLRQLHQ